MSNIAYVGILVLIFVFFFVYLLIAERLESRQQDMHLKDTLPPMTKNKDKK
ncbi:MAG: hypothetical protein OXU81_18830 [Gammaproteobacteria bacterium]|nr:hypothetical protein [Gammaproteobacteria bacterium]